MAFQAFTIVLSVTVVLVTAIPVICAQITVVEV
jgi:hypothetical protein